MNEQLLARLDALAEIDADIRTKLDGPDGQHLDGLSMAKLLVAVDGAARKLAALADDLQPSFFPSGDGKDGEADPPQQPADPKKRK